VYLGGFTKNEPIATQESEELRLEKEQKDLEEVKKHSLYYQEE
jgi:hypothetical protein